MDCGPPSAHRRRSPQRHQVSRCDRSHRVANRAARPRRRLRLADVSRGSCALYPARQPDAGRGRQSGRRRAMHRRRSRRALQRAGNGSVHRHGGGRRACARPCRQRQRASDRYRGAAQASARQPGTQRPAAQNGAFDRGAPARRGETADREDARMNLTDSEQAMLDGRAGPAKQKAMDLLMRYGDALGAERLVETNNVAGAFNASTPSVRALVAKGYDAVYSELNLDSAEVVPIPKMAVNTCQLITGIDNEKWRIQGIPDELADQQKKAECYFGARGINMFATCTPYQVGNVPVKGEHCAWMDSSAVVYCNSVLGARTNTEGKESTGAAALTGRIPYFGYHIKENRRGTHKVDIEIDVDDIMEWGLLGNYHGEIVDAYVPVLTGYWPAPNLIKLKHFGAAAASSGGVEMYHIPDVTPEARSLEQAFGGNRI